MKGPRKVPSRKHLGEPGYNAASPLKLQARINEQRCIELRLAGDTYEQIAVKLGCTRMGVYNAIMRVLDRDILAETQRLIPRARQVEIRRLDVMNKALWARVKRGDDKAISVALQIAARRARLCGLDAEIQLHHSGSVDSKMSIEIFRQMMTEGTKPEQNQLEDGNTIDIEPTPDIPDVPPDQKVV